MSESKCKESPLIQKICESENSIDSFLKLVKVRDEFYYSLMNKLSSEVGLKFNDLIKERDDWVFSTSNNDYSWLSTGKYFRLSKSNENFEIVFGTEKTSFEDWFFSFRFYDCNNNVENKLDIEKLGEYIKSKLKDKNVKHDDWNPCYYLSEKYKYDWKDRAEPWHDIQNGKMAEYIFEGMKEILSYVEEYYKD